MRQVLAVDIGNSTTGCGLFQDDALVWTGHLPTDPDRTVPALADWLTGELACLPADPAGIDQTVLSSVVPKATAAVCAEIRGLTGREPILADRHSIGLSLAVSQPETVGADRLVCALAAACRCACPVIIVDLGTAVTISIVDSQGRFIGGTISPGLQTAATALHQATAQLPELDIASLFGQAGSLPDMVPVIGENTAACIYSGIIQGTAAMIDGLTERIEGQLGCPASRVITGGLALLVQPFCRQTFRHEPYLLLQGLKLLADRKAQEDT